MKAWTALLFAFVASPALAEECHPFLRAETGDCWVIKPPAPWIPFAMPPTTIAAPRTERDGNGNEATNGPTGSSNGAASGRGGGSSAPSSRSG